MGFCACVSATFLNDTPSLGLLILAAAVAPCAALRALIELRKLPAIVVTLGMSFVWGACRTAATVALPVWLTTMMKACPPFMAMAMIACVLLAVAGHLLITRSAPGTLLRAVGGNARSVAHAGWSTVRLKATAYGLAGVFGVLSGMALVGLTISADSNIAFRYTL